MDDALVVHPNQPSGNILGNLQQFLPRKQGSLAEQVRKRASDQILGDDAQTLVETHTHELHDVGVSQRSG